MKYKSEEHRIWHRRVEGQIQSAMNEHPEYFAERDAAGMRFIKRSLAKRIVGEILAHGCQGAGERD